MSQEIFDGAPVFPGYPAKSIEYVARHEDRQSAPVKLEGLTHAAMMLHVCDQGPTHVDSISHIDESPGAPWPSSTMQAFKVVEAVLLSLCPRVVSSLERSALLAGAGQGETGSS